MVVWCALATAVFVVFAPAHSFKPTTSAPDRLLLRRNNRHPLSNLLSQPNDHAQHMQGSLWGWRRRSARTRLSPADTGVPEVASAADDLATLGSTGGDGKSDGRGAGRGGSSSPVGKKQLTERGGLLLLCTVPLVWGTYGPSVKFLYQMGESPPGLLFNFACYVVSLLTLAAAGSFDRRRGACVLIGVLGAWVSGVGGCVPLLYSLSSRIWHGL